MVTRFITINNVNRSKKVRFLKGSFKVDVYSTGSSNVHKTDVV